MSVGLSHGSKLGHAWRPPHRVQRVGEAKQFKKQFEVTWVQWRQRLTTRHLLDRPKLSNGHSFVLEVELVSNPARINLVVRAHRIPLHLIERLRRRDTHLHATP